MMFTYNSWLADSLYPRECYAIATHNGPPGFLTGAVPSFEIMGVNILYAREASFLQAGVIKGSRAVEISGLLNRNGGNA